MLCASVVLGAGLNTDVAVDKPTAKTAIAIKKEHSAAMDRVNRDFAGRFMVDSGG